MYRGGISSYIRVVRVLLLSVIRTVEMIMWTNGLLDSSTKVPKNQRKTVNSLMKYASMTWNKDQRQAVFVWRMGWRFGWNRLHNHAILPFLLFSHSLQLLMKARSCFDQQGEVRQGWRYRCGPEGDCDCPSACLVYLILFYKGGVFFSGS